MLCRVRWQANDYGTIRWQLMVMQAATPLDATQRIPACSQARACCCMQKVDANVRAVLERIDGIEALGIAAIDVSPAYWRMLAQPARRAFAGCPNTPPSGMPPGWPGGRCHDSPSHRRTHAQSCAASSLAPARSPRAGGHCRRRPRCAGLGGFRAAVAAPDLQPVRQRSGRLVSRRSAAPRRRLAATSLVRGQRRRDDAAARCCRARRAALATCPLHVPLLKRVGAVAPQHVSHSRRSGTHRQRADGRCAATDRLGRPLPSLQLCRRLEAGELFLLSVTNPASFDSRYFGPVSASAVIGVAHPIWWRHAHDGHRFTARYRASHRAIRRVVPAVAAVSSRVQCGCIRIALRAVFGAAV
ncbi:DUF2840 domain-containing protein [Pseudomonas aeruginosa]